MALFGLRLVAGGGGAGNTIYTADDSLTGNRTVDLDGNNLDFNNTNGTNSLLSLSDNAFGEISNTIGGLFLDWNGASRLYLGNGIINNKTGNFTVSNYNGTQTSLNISPNASGNLTINNSVGSVFKWGTSELQMAGSFTKISRNGTTKIHLNNNSTIIGSGATSPIGIETVSLQSSTAIKGIGTSGSSALAIYDNDTTPNKLWDFLDNGNVELGGNSSVVLSGNDLTFDCGTTGKFVINGSNTTENQVFTFQHNGNTSFLLTKEGKIQNTNVVGNDVLDMTNSSKNSGIILNTSLAQVFSPQLLFRKSTSDANGVRITTSSTSEETKWQRTSSLNYVHQIKSGTTTNIVNFFKLGWSNSQGFLVGSGAKVGS